MSDYQLEIKQIVDYPRCRVYREFVQSLISDRNIRANGSSGLFHYTVLCSYANFRTSYRRLDGISYTVYPGEWVCRLSELVECLRLRTRRQALQILEKLQEQNFIQYSILGRGHLVKYRIKGWRRHNTVLDYNCPCQKETGFFFLPISIANELISVDRCSEMDIILDLWLSAVYNDTQVQGSFAGPVAYFRNGSGYPPHLLRRPFSALGYLKSHSWACFEKTYQGRIYLYAHLPRTPRHSDLSPKLFIHHVPGI